MRLVKFSYINPEAYSIPQKPLLNSQISVNPTHKITFRYVESGSTPLFTTSFDREAQASRNTKPQAYKPNLQAQLGTSGVSTFAQQEEKRSWQIQMLRNQLYQSVQQYSALLERKAQNRININNSLQQRNLIQMDLHNGFLAREQELKSLRRLLDSIEYE